MSPLMILKLSGQRKTLRRDKLRFLLLRQQRLSTKEKDPRRKKKAVCAIKNGQRGRM